MDKKMTFHILRQSAKTYALIALAAEAKQDEQIFTQNDLTCIPAGKVVRVTYEILDDKQKSLSLGDFLERLAVPA